MTRHLGLTVAASLVAFSLLGSDPARAGTQTILGRLFRIYFPAAGRRSAVCFGVEHPSPNSIVGNPLLNGATVRIIANGDNPQDQTFTVPPGSGWTAMGSIGWKYLDLQGVNGPVERAVILNPNGKFILRAVVKGTATAPPPGVGLVPPGHGADGGMVFTINGGDSYCVTLGGAAGGLARDAPLNLGFRIRRAASETGCPMPATTTSTSTCTTTTSTDTTTTT